MTDHGELIVERALSDELECTQVLQRLTACRGAIDGLLVKVLEDNRSDAKDIKDLASQSAQALGQVAEQADLGGKAQDALGQGRCWVAALVAALGWFWAVARAKVAALDLPEEAEQAVYDKVLAGLYWRQAARRGRGSGSTPRNRRTSPSQLRRSNAGSTSS